MILFYSRLAMDTFRKRTLLKDLALRDFRNAYIGSGFGALWLFLEPLIYIGVMWFVLSQGLKVKPQADVPYIAWLMSTMVAWSFFSGVAASLPGFFKGYKYLLNREFNFSTLPIARILSGILFHGIFLTLLLLLLVFNQVPVTWYWLQVIYYLFCLCVLLLAFSLILSSLGLFARDVGNLVSVLLQLGFWVSPIFWDPNSVPQKYLFFLKLNPLYYPIEGYRDSFLYGTPIWNEPKQLIYFWVVTLVLLATGALTYRRLRPHFGDVI